MVGKRHMGLGSSADLGLRLIFVTFRLFGPRKAHGFFDPSFLSGKEIP